jgi:hypothetical protein
MPYDILENKRKVKESSPPNTLKKIKRTSKKEENKKSKDIPFFIDPPLPGDPCTPPGWNDPRKPAPPHPHPAGEEEDTVDPSQHPPVVAKENIIKVFLR